MADYAVIALEKARILQEKDEAQRQIEDDRHVQIQTIAHIAESIAATSKGLHETLRGILAWIEVLMTAEGKLPWLIEIFSLNKQENVLNLLEGWSGGKPHNRLTPDIPITGRF